MDTSRWGTWDFDWSRDTTDDQDDPYDQAGIQADPPQDAEDVTEETTDDVEPSNSSDDTQLVLRIHNPLQTGLDVKFVANRKTYLLSPGEYVRLDGQPTWSVEFHRGGDLGSSRNKLSTGDYVFAVSETGWQLGESDDPTALSTVKRD